MRKPLVIIGSGHAGYSLARAFRQRDARTPVIVLSRDGGELYPKPQLSHGFSRSLSAEALTQADAPGMASEWKLMVRPRTRVEDIDFGSRIVIAGGARIPYGDLVLAVGAEPFVPPMQGDAASEVLTLNDLDQYRRYRERLDRGDRVVVIGGGLIGAELAHDLSEGKRVTLVDVGDRLLERLVPEVVSLGLQDRLPGVAWRFGNRVERIDRVGAAYRVELADGEALEADAVVCAAGLRPRLELAAGLETGRGILVDACLRTSQPHVFALGDCAEIDGRVLPFLQPISLSAQALARTLAGELTPVRFGRMPVAVKTPRYPIQLAGATHGEDLAWTLDENSDGLIARSWRDGRLAGFVAAGGRNGMALLSELEDD
ncbi:FAD-dependent oxidoreductase [Chromobacterium phragmitis]|uniref:FAD-dependent oxidoreductase n=1 Tax=Chromobacterium phragmitis TaxID=2202141 RepID=UPI000DEC8719|nr:FAD-dependent oxidoreductase [Chromobacterium phragmitis]AXE31664.1 FAD-dependent oxidoreductase [Chromobacterium phragmitis]